MPDVVLNDRRRESPCQIQVLTPNDLDVLLTLGNVLIIQRDGPAAR